MRVYVYPNEYDPMGYYRLIWPARALQNIGYDVTILGPDIPDRLDWVPDHDGNVMSVNYPADADVIVVQRVTQRQMVTMIQMWRDAGIAVVLDMDDDLSAVDREHNPNAYKLLNNPDTPDLSWRWTEEAAKSATLVTCSTPAAAERYGGTVVWNYIPEAWTQIPYADGWDKGWGWSGAVPFRYLDPTVMGRVPNWLQRNGYPMMVVGQGQYIKEAFGLVRDPERYTGFVPIEMYPYYLRELNIGISPLIDNAFNRSKSHNKMLEYAAVGVPCVVSPQVEYLRLARQGVGLVARNPTQWRRHIVDLANNTDLWLEKRAKGRAVAARYTIERHVMDWWFAWEDAKRRQSNGT